LNGSRFEKTHGYCTDVFMDRAGDWMAQCQAQVKPFFTMVTPNAPHSPYVIPSEEWAAPYRNRGLSTHAVAYYAMIAHLDAAHDLGVSLHEAASIRPELEWQSG
jgi:arylsulfatase A-like enzyme